MNRLDELWPNTGALSHDALHTHQCTQVRCKKPSRTDVLMPKAVDGNELGGCTSLLVVSTKKTREIQECFVRYRDMKLPLQADGELAEYDAPQGVTRWPTKPLPTNVTQLQAQNITTAQGLLE